MKKAFQIISLILVTVFVTTNGASAEVDFEEKYRQVSKHLHSNNFGEAAEALEELRSLGYDQGYENLSLYAFRLLEFASNSPEQNNKETVSFLLRQAEMLAPSDPQVCFAQASFYSLIGPIQALGYFFRGWLISLTTPTIIVPLIWNCFWIVLVCSTVALLFVCILRLVANQELLLLVLSARVKSRYRGILTPLLLLSLLIFPLALGLLGALAGWCLILGRSDRKARTLTFHAGVIILLWGTTLPIAYRINLNHNSKLTHVLEKINHGSYFLGASTTLSEMYLAKGDPLFWFLSGSAFYREGKLDDAAQALSEAKLLAEGLGRNSLANTALVNMGAVEMLRKNYPKAREYFSAAENNGAKSFELYYNSSQVHLTMLDTTKHKRYYNLASAKDSTRLREQDNRTTGADSSYRKVLLTQAPAREMYSIYLKPLTGAHSAGESDFLRSLPLSMIRGGSRDVLIAIGIVMLIAGFFIRPSRTVVRRSPLSSVYRTHHSPIWLVLPAGADIVGDHPGRGFVVLTVVFSLVVTALERPINMLQIFPYALPLGPFAIAITTLIICLSIWLSRASIRGELRTSQGLN